MKYLVLALLLLSSPALAEKPDTPPCIQKEQALTNLLREGFMLRAEMENNHKLVAIFSNGEGDWIALELTLDDKLCIAGMGRGFHQILGKKA